MATATLPRPATRVDRSGPAPATGQLSIDDLGTPLCEVTFVVVDLETTGGSPRDCEITEIGAVKVRGGQVLGEFATLVNPRQQIPPFIAALTGITQAMVATAPPIKAVLPSFLDFCRGSVLVAHNARFDIGFLKTACTRQHLGWPNNQVLDTVALSRHVLGRDEVRNHRLATLAPYFGADTVPNHRALDDARATVDVLHGLLERVGNVGVSSFEDLATFTSRVPAARRRKRHLAEGLPHAPGVYVFTGPREEVLYVGTSTDLRRRVRSYFTASETRARIGEMLQLATAVTPIICQTPLEAQVRELRLIAEHRPRYNRRSRNPGEAPWVKLTVETFPRLSIVRAVRDDDAVYLGPFANTRSAEAAVEALHEVFPLRRCTARLPTRPGPKAHACILAEIGRCAAPCVGGIDRQGYSDLVARVQQTITGAATPVTTGLLAKISSLAAEQRYEDAARHRDRLEAFLVAADRTQRRAPLAECAELVAARRREHSGGWEVALVRHGKLAGSTLTTPGADPMPAIGALQQSGEVVTARPGGAGLAALPGETDLVLRWLAQPGVRLVHLDGEWTCPVGGAAAARSMLAATTVSLPTP
jgi:DNA polymerase-3 subunit epsilon